MMKLMMIANSVFQFSSLCYHCHADNVPFVAMLLDLHTS